MAAMPEWVGFGDVEPAFIAFSDRDVEALQSDIRAAADLGFETSDAFDAPQRKKWGHELSVFRDIFFDATVLWIQPGAGTSLHCHPFKATALIVLAGQGEVSGLGGTPKVSVGPGSVVFIGGGALHETRNTGTDPLTVLEVESPRNKACIVRHNHGDPSSATTYVPSVLMLDCPPLEPAAGLGRLGRIRRHDPSGRWSFSIEAGRDLAQDWNGAVCAVRVDIADALARQLHVVLDPQHHQLNGLSRYLVVRRSGTGVQRAA